MRGAELDEIIAALKRSAVPTLVVEGRDDYVAFGEFEVENVSWGFTVLPVNGEGNVQKIIEKVEEINHPALAFLLDRDCSLFTGISYGLLREDTFFTDGYSIENDLIRDGNIIQLVKVTDKAWFTKELSSFANFCSCAAFGHVENRVGFPLSTHPNQLFRAPGKMQPQYELFIEDISNILPEAYRQVAEDPLRLTRGKSLLALLARHFVVRRKGAKFSRASILELGDAARGPLMLKIEHDILAFFRHVGTYTGPVDMNTAG